MSRSTPKGVLDSYGYEPLLIAGELAKKNAERRMMHEILTEARIPTHTPSGEAICLLNRLTFAVDLLGMHEDAQEERLKYGTVQHRRPAAN